jgi:protein-tyrosine phosphatase
MPLTFSIVVICTGNRFRSPLAEHLLRRAVEGLPVEVSSAGTQELAAGGALPEALELGAELGLDLSAHRSRMLANGVAAEADLVLGFERRHIVRAVVDGGADRGRTFTLGELAALLRAIETPTAPDRITRARAAVAEADRLRHRLQANAAELADPWGSSPETYRRTAMAVSDLVAAVTAGLFGL